MKDVGWNSLVQERLQSTVAKKSIAKEKEIKNPIFLIIDISTFLFSKDVIHDWTNEILTAAPLYQKDSVESFQASYHGAFLLPSFSGIREMWIQNKVDEQLISFSLWMTCDTPEWNGESPREKDGQTDR